ncbi:MAG TPA: hypothetical protein VGS20_08540 [Candidatus Acidoferrales bacterium]|nr:hypothetical protein [Candidatus Acidoferrales bacterium]
MRKAILAVAVCLVIPFPLALARNPSSQAKGSSQGANSQHPPGNAHAAMNERGEKGMGFSQTATTHHFLLNPTGGAIQVEAKDPADSANRDMIRMHLQHIAHAFAAGDFDIPMFIHDRIPPGVPQMKRLRADIHYSYQETPRGGRVEITTADKEARDAIWKFLRFQITEHKTGDPLHAR